MYYAIYKCRLCSEQFFYCGTSKEDIALGISMRTALGLQQKEIQSPTLIAVHTCKNGSFGIADFLGMKNENEDGDTNDLS